MKLSCHCKNIKIEVEAPTQLTRCNCSLCSRYQALWGYYEPQQVSIRLGDGGEEIYIWGDRELEFVRCANCGCISHYRTVQGQPDPRIGVNFSLAGEESVADIPVRYFDGKSEL